MKATDTMKLVHAASRVGHLEMVKYLMKYCDITATDSNGWNCLHYCLTLSAHSDMLNFLFDNGCDAFAIDVYGYSPLSLSIEKEPAFAEKLLQSKTVSKGIHTHFTLKGYEVFEFQFDGIELPQNNQENTKKLLQFRRYADLSQSVNSKFTWKEKKVNKANEIITPYYSIIELLIANERKDLLNLPIIQSLIDAKWKCFGKYNYLSNVFLYCIFLFSFLFCLFQIPTQSDIHFQKVDSNLIIATIILLLSTTRLYFMEFREFASKPKRYVTSLWNLFDIIGLVFMTPILLLITQNVFSLKITETISEMLLLQIDISIFTSISIFFLTLKFLQYGTIPKTTGPLIIITKGMMIDVGKFFALFFIIYAAFVLCFYFLMNSPSNIIELKSVAWLLLCWIIGMIEYEDLLGCEERIVIIHIFFILYILVIVIMLLNLLIAMMSNTFQAVVENADIEWMSGYTEELMGIQQTLSNSSIKKYISFIDKIQKERQKLSAEALHRTAESQNWAGLIRERLQSLESKLEKIESLLEAKNQ